MVFVPLHQLHIGYVHGQGVGNLVGSLFGYLRDSQKPLSLYIPMSTLSRQPGLQLRDSWGWSYTPYLMSL